MQTMIDMNSECKQQYLTSLGYSWKTFQLLEEIRGCPIDFIGSDGEKSIPTIETSYSECMEHIPLVSVSMITYNHEQYIAEAIEGVVNQHCDFYFELIIGDDCSNDRTLEICKEYQRKYPGIVRLLTYPKNLMQNGFNNSNRCISRCRGKYLAFCEGDDYWVDNRKLQKEIDVLEQNPEIGLVATNYWKKNKELNKTWNCNCYAGHSIRNMYEEDYPECGRRFAMIQTAGVIIRTDKYKEALRISPIFHFDLKIGDIQMMLNAVYPSGNYYVLNDYTYVYRQHPGGATAGERQFQMRIDQMVVLAYFDNVLHGELDEIRRMQWEVRTWDDKFELAMIKHKEQEYIKGVISKVAYICQDTAKYAAVIGEIQHLIMIKWLFRNERPLLKAIAKEMDTYGVPVISKKRFWLIRFFSWLLPCVAGLQVAHWLRRLGIKLNWLSA